MFEYGSRVGFWRLHRIFARRKLPCTIFAIARALERNPEACAAMREADWDGASAHERGRRAVQQPETRQQAIPIVVHRN
jgi:peptidoglycan/xylan/chitin deacetylase (PgdA/CDA1 family)